MTAPVRVTKDESVFTMTVRDVAEQSGVAESAVRFYERHGLVEAARTRGNQRRFAPDAPCRIKVARVAQRVGLTVREIGAVLSEVTPDSTPDVWARVGDRLVAEARERIRRLQETLDDLGSGQRLCEIDD